MKVKEIKNIVKKPRKPLRPMLINAIAFVIGVVLVFVGFAVPYIRNTELLSVTIGVGTGFLSSSVINFLFELRARNMILRIITNATMESWDTVNKVRDEQTVELKFTKVGNKIHVETKHTFVYVGIGKFAYNDTVSIYNDYKGILSELSKCITSTPPCYFREVRIADDIYSWDNESDRGDLFNISNGKLCYNKQIKIPSQGGNIRLQFDIHSEYELTDRLVWVFQEISEDAKLYIKIDDESCKEMVFGFSLNHPLMHNILNDNKNIIQTDSRTGKITYIAPNKYIHINRKILPNQGFEISWKTTE